MELEMEPGSKGEETGVCRSPDLEVQGKKRTLHSEAARRRRKDRPTVAPEKPCPRRQAPPRESHTSWPPAPPRHRLDFD